MLKGEALPLNGGNNSDNRTAHLFIAYGRCVPGSYWDRCSVDYFYSGTILRRGRLREQVQSNEPHQHTQTQDVTGYGMDDEEED